MARDAVKAVKWFERASELGDVKVQKNLGIIFQKGRGVEKDYSKAAEWFLETAKQGLKTAKWALRMMGEKAIGCLKGSNPRNRVGCP